MKQGANRVDQTRIAKLAGEKKSAEEISKILLIDQKVVENFIPKAVEKPAEKK